MLIIEKNGKRYGQVFCGVWISQRIVIYASVASGNKTEIKVFRNHIPCPRILKLIRRNEWFNSPENVPFPKKLTYMYWLLFFITRFVCCVDIFETDFNP